jgi:uncharacterized protein (UPF0276 family)
MQGATMNNLNKHTPGFGLGLREAHFDHILSHWPEVDWFEIISENFIRMDEGHAYYQLRRLAERYPIAMHGVSLAIGSTDPLDHDYLSALKSLADKTDPLWISDHLCRSGIMNAQSHELQPVALNQDSLKHIAARIRVVQEILERPLILENPGTVTVAPNSDIAEPDFLRLLTEETGCGLLLDINNVKVTCTNTGLDPVEYIRALPMQRIVQMHLARHKYGTPQLQQTEDNLISGPVWKLFLHAWFHTHGVPVLLEWDAQMASFDAYQVELVKAQRQVERECLFGVHHPANASLKHIPNSVALRMPDVLRRTGVTIIPGKY